MVDRIVPILAVRDLEESKQYYVDRLGFQVDWEFLGASGVSRDGCEIMLVQDTQGLPGTWLWIGVKDVDAMYAEMVKRGANIRHAPQNYPWALEIKVEDLDGHVLRIGSNPKEDQPYENFTY